MQGGRSHNLNKTSVMVGFNWCNLLSTPKYAAIKDIKRYNEITICASVNTIYMILEKSCWQTCSLAVSWLLPLSHIITETELTWPWTLHSTWHVVVRSALTLSVHLSVFIYQTLFLDMLAASKHGKICLSAHHIGSDWNFEWNAKTFCAGFEVPQRVIPQLFL